MNQRLAWCWGETHSPPLTDLGYRLIGTRSYRAIWTRKHLRYGLLLGRIFIGLTVSRAL